MHMINITLHNYGFHIRENCPKMCWHSDTFIYIYMIKNDINGVPVHLDGGSELPQSIVESSFLNQSPGQLEPEASVPGG